MRKVITYGTFDLFHRGHYNILKRAKECGDYLIVGVTGENYDTERGKLSVQESLSQRIENVKKTGFADEIIVEEYLGQKISDILKYDIDVLVIGSDWKGKFDHLRKYCEVIYLERTKDISSTQIREENLQLYKFGIVTDSLYDNEALIEPKCVSGIHVESVYSDNEELAHAFAEKYELDKGYSRYDDFLKNVDIVYIKADIDKRKQLVEAAINQGKHVICDAPITLEIDETEKLALAAQKKGVVMLVNIPLLYLQSFGQLSWMTRGNMIGDIVSIKCSISKSNFNAQDQKSILDVAYYPICTAIKLLGNGYENCICKTVQDKDGNIIYTTIVMEYEDTTFFSEIGMELSVEDGMLITGTEGMIYVPDDWWNLGYFKLKRKGEHRFKRYSYNFDGNGLRYLIRSMLHMIKESSVSEQRVTGDESESILSALQEVSKTVK